MAPLNTLSRALRQLHVFTSRFDWFIELSVLLVIGWSDYVYDIQNENCSSSTLLAFHKNL